MWHFPAKGLVRNKKNYINHHKIEHVFSAKPSRTEDNLNLEFSGDKATWEFVFNALLEKNRNIFLIDVVSKILFISFPFIVQFWYQLVSLSWAEVKGSKKMD